MKQIFSLLALASLFFAGVVFADGYEDGRAAANRGEFADAYAFWKPLADSGDPRAAYDLGRMYARGDGVHKDFGIARSYFERASTMNFGPALLALGKMYYFGDGGVQDNTKAYDYFSRASSRGVKEADGFLQKLTPPQQPIVAARDQGAIQPSVPVTMAPQFATPVPNSPAAFGDNSVPPPPPAPDTSAALPSTASADPLSPYRTQSPSAVIGSSGRGVRFDPVAEAIILAMPGGQSLFSSYDTSLFYGPLVSDDKALANFLAEANGGNAEAQNILGFAALKTGNAELAKSWFDRSSQQNNGIALFALGNIAFDSNYARSAEFFAKAADLGVVPAQRNYGYFLLKGIGVNQDPAHAKVLLQQAAQRGDTLAADLAK